MDDPILQTLRGEKAAKISGGLYAELQARKNRAEKGTRLSHA